MVNDRLLLGLKGIMSDFEMATLRQRALEAQRTTAQRGELWMHLPRFVTRNTLESGGRNALRSTAGVSMTYPGGRGLQRPSGWRRREPRIAGTGDGALAILMDAVGVPFELVHASGEPTSRARATVPRRGSP